MKLRVTIFFNGDKYHSSVMKKLQVFDENEWKDIPEEWASKEDEEKYNRAVKNEYVRNPR